MAARIRFNPVTGEIEIEGSEAFVKEYFARLQKRLPESPDKTGKRRKNREAGSSVKAGKGSKKAKGGSPKKARGAAKKVPAEKRGGHLEAVLEAIQGSPGGISTTGLKEKTGLNERQIWATVNRAAKAGKIKKTGRGIYAGGDAAGE